MKLDVLDLGYIRLVDNMGSDLTVANTARVSFDKESKELNLKDEKLIYFLVEHNHSSCFRHCAMTFEVYAPLMTVRQWQKHMIASSHIDDQVGWNETSRRYVTENEQFYIPEHFLAAPDNKKQGAAGPVDDETNLIFRRGLDNMQRLGLDMYEKAMAAGIAPEQARLFLPAYGLYIRWRWTASLGALMNFLDQRLDSHAQSEIREYAEALQQIVQQYYPVTYSAWRKHNG